MDLLDRLLGHDAWTTGRLIDLSRGLRDDQLDAPFDVGLGSLRATLEHMIDAVGFWTAAIEGRSEPMPDGDGRSLDDLAAAHARSYAAFVALARRLRDADGLDGTFVDAYGWPKSFGGTIAQVVTHNAQHRGEIMHMLARLGVSGLPDGDPQEWEYAVGIVEPPGPPSGTP